MHLSYAASTRHKLDLVVMLQGAVRIYYMIAVFVVCQ